MDNQPEQGIPFQEIESQINWVDFDHDLAQKAITDARSFFNQHNQITTLTPRDISTESPVDLDSFLIDVLGVHPVVTTSNKDSALYLFGLRLSENNGWPTINRICMLEAAQHDNLHRIRIYDKDGGSWHLVHGINDADLNEVAQDTLNYSLSLEEPPPPQLADTIWK